ncbi:MAG: hypothetical protein V5B36_03265 [Candidatus Accumulibacter sp. UW25]
MGEYRRGILAISFYGPLSSSAETGFNYLKQELPAISSVMERMQVLNTLATLSLALDHPQMAEKFILENESLVAGNLEYEIYWRWN